jgi:hypothetical protein
MSVRLKQAFPLIAREIHPLTKEPQADLLIEAMKVKFQFII